MMCLAWTCKFPGLRDLEITGTSSQPVVVHLGGLRVSPHFAMYQILCSCVVLRRKGRVGK